MCLFLSSASQALCINVQSSDVLETLSLIFCGADVNCSTGMASCPSPLSLASAHSQPLQAELISHNLNTGTCWCNTCMHTVRKNAKRRLLIAQLQYEYGIISFVFVCAGGLTMSGLAGCMT